MHFQDAYADSGRSLPGRWVHSQELRVGDRLYGCNGGSRAITRIAVREDRLAVYNLSVRGQPYYAVGPLGVLVHNSESQFNVGTHGDMPSPRGDNESHHGVMSKWMEKNYKDYNKNKAPAVLMPTLNHNATRGAFNKWRAEMERKLGGKIDWSKISEKEIRELSEKMFDAAKVPKSVRDEYYRRFSEFLQSMKPK